MPEIVLYVKPGSHVSVTRQREQLAVELAQNVRAMVAKAGSDVGVPWSEDHMDVDIVLRHADAVNVAGLAITVALSPGADNTVFDARYAIREALRVSVVAWAAEVRDRFSHALPDGTDLDVRLRFAFTAGVNCGLVTGEVNSRWG